VRSEERGVTSALGGSMPGESAAVAIKMPQTEALNAFAKNNTGRTALSRTACFVQRS
jgi:hypothetical protein